VDEGRPERALFLKAKERCPGTVNIDPMSFCSNNKSCLPLEVHKWCALGKQCKQTQWQFLGNLQALAAILHLHGIIAPCTGKKAICMGTIVIMYTPFVLPIDISRLSNVMGINAQ